MQLYRGIAVTLAGSDSGGGAGIQADLKTCAALKVFGMTVITALTAQNSTAVTDVLNVPPDMIRAQIDALWSDFPIGAAKTGMLSVPQTISTVVEGIRRWKVSNLVVDPVMVAQSGAPLIADDAVESLRRELLPLALLVTPNVPEAERLAKRPIRSIEEMEQAAHEIEVLGPKAVLVKGGHLLQENEVADVLLYQGKTTVFRDSRIFTNNTHGTGCTLSAAITAELASGADLFEAVSRARQYLRMGLEAGFRPGKGWGPLGHAVVPPWLER
jgi:hydroxymethylpyrimidine/phosphomethylpyrimidine kinase